MTLYLFVWHVKSSVIDWLASFFFLLLDPVRLFEFLWWWWWDLVCLAFVSDTLIHITFSDDVVLLNKRDNNGIAC